MSNRSPTYLQLEKDRTAASNDIEALEPSLDGGGRDRGQARALPQVARVMTLSTFIPDQQDAKLPLIQERGKDARSGAQSANDAPSRRPTRITVAMINSHGRCAQSARRRRAWSRAPTPPTGCRRGSSTLAKADPLVRQRAETAFVQPLQTALDDLRNLLKAHEVTRDNLPPDLVDQWITPDGRARLEVTPSGNAERQCDVADVSRMTCRAVAPNATEGPISILEARAHDHHRLSRGRRIRAVVDRRAVVDHPAAGRVTCC